MYQILQYFMKSMVRNPPEYLRVLVLMLAVLLYGTTGFLYFELPANPDLSWADGLWYTIVTIATVGYGDFFPKSFGGRFLVGWPIMGFWNRSVGLCTFHGGCGAGHLQDKGDQGDVSL